MTLGSEDERHSIPLGQTGRNGSIFGVIRGTCETEKIQNRTTTMTHTYITPQEVKIFSGFIEVFAMLVGGGLLLFRGEIKLSVTKHWDTFDWVGFWTEVHPKVRSHVSALLLVTALVSDRARVLWLFTERLVCVLWSIDSWEEAKTTC